MRSQSILSIPLQKYGTNKNIIFCSSAVLLFIVMTDICLITKLNMENKMMKNIYGDLGFH